MGINIEERLSYIESLFVKHGAVKTDITYEGDDEKGRTVYSFNGVYACVGTLTFPESDEPYLVISCSEDEKFAKVGILDDVDAFAADTPDEEIEERIRQAFGLN